MAAAQPITLVFGSQDLDVTPASLAELRRALLESPDLKWIIDTIHSLPQQWLVLQAVEPSFEHHPGLDHLTYLLDWLRRGEYSGSFPLPNIVITPLVVATQLIQFIEFVKRHQPDMTSKDSLASVLQSPIQTSGLCTGLLSASAVASSRTLTDLEQNGATAIRLAMAIGAFVDAADQNEPKASLVAGWTTSDVDGQIDQIVEGFSEAYLAVKAEARQFTITTRKKDAFSLTARLRDAGCVVTQTSLRGAFHLSNQAARAQQLIDYFDSNDDYHFTRASYPMVTVNSTSDGLETGTGPLHHLTTKAMLCEFADWHTLFTRIADLNTGVVSFGRKRFIPQSIGRKLDSRLMHAGDNSSKLPTSASHNDVAIIGMACHVPGGKDIHEFWETLCTGASQHKEVPEDRIRFNSPWRKGVEGRKWFGNFIDDHAAFDHKFFKKTPVEMASTDPQQRLIMQVAYQAVQQSGYFATPTPNTNVACYIGIGPNDYEGSVANHEATAYTATGNLRSFAAGKISHYFGWSAPGITIDTACSSSAVAIHEACKAIIAGECDSAVAGGTNHLSGAEWFQNLAGASFLSLTGQCKPFDASGDGYCRSEGAGAIVLKKLSQALKDGDQIYGVVKATSVAQNENCSAITAPTANSLSENFRAAIAKSGLPSKQISLVEAHGTGTSVGDKAEYTAIRDVFAGDGRSSPLTLGSAKGHIGHLESASGIASVIKTLLQMRHASIPPQASHQNFNPNLPGTKDIQISRSKTQWSNEFKAALINNYGASGSNASIVLSEAPRNALAMKLRAPVKQPFWLCAHHEGSLRTYAAKLAQLIRSAKEDLSIASLAFHTSLQTNRLLDRSIVFCSDSTQDLVSKLESYAESRPDKSVTATSRSSQRPVILAFGGQISASVSISQELYESTALFRKHLDHCDELVSSMGHERIMPRVFDPRPNEDVVQLQLTLFSVEYASAQSWIDSGIQVAAVVGHSFGELVAMCVSGALSLRDALWMVAGRAQTIQQKWGTDSGCMLWVESDEGLVKALLKDAQSKAEIACINGPRSFTIAGTNAEIDELQAFLSTSQQFSSMRSKRLTVTNAFHSKLVDPLMPELQSIGEKLIWRTATIHQEPATKDAISHRATQSDFVARHMRDPVYFSAAVQRLAARHPDAIWLEVGTSSGITSMASKALGSTNAFFQPISLSSIDSLADATASLWKQGLNVSFWQHHRSQTRDHAPVLLPPYQFDKHVHWLERKEIPTTKEVTPAVVPGPVAPPSLWTFLGYQPSSKDRDVEEAHFLINSTSTDFQTHVSAHVIAQSEPICPTGFQYRIATNAIASLVKSAKTAVLRSELQGMENHAPIVNDISREIRLIAQKIFETPSLWSWRIESTAAAGGKSTLHVNGQVLFVESNPLEQDHMFARYERLVNYQQCKKLLESSDADDVLQGQRNIYKIFSPMVHYNEDEYKGLHKIVAKGTESAGRIVRTKSSGTLNNGLADSFCQVAGIFANCMSDCDGTEMYLSNKLEHWIAPTEFPGEVGTVYEVYARHSRPSDKEWLSDIFVFDPTSGRLLAAIFGMGFIKMKIAGMARMLESLTGNAQLGPTKSVEVVAPVEAREACIVKPAEPAKKTPAGKSKSTPVVKKKVASPIEGQLRGVLCDMLGLEESDILPSSDLIDCGVDSLLAMELAKDVQRVCNVELDTSALLSLTDFQSLVDAVRERSGEEIADDCSSDDCGTDVDDMYDSGLGSPLTTPAKVDKPGDKSMFFNAPPETNNLPLSAIVSTFEETKILTDEFIRRHKLAGFSHGVLPTQNELVLVHIMDAFEKLGCDLRTASPGQVLPRILYLERHKQIVDVFYNLLQQARVVDIANDKIVRTAVPTSTKSAPALLQELLKTSPEQGHDHKLTSLSGEKLAECLKGEAEGVQILFGSAENRAIVSASYAESPIHSTMVNQLAQFFYGLVEKVGRNRKEPIKIMELGAGTGGTTSTLLPILAASGVPVQYTCTDLSSGLVAGLRKRFNKQFPFTKFEVVNMETAPPSHLLHEQDAILATNCVHATKDLSITTKNIHDMLRPGGFLVMIEMTSVLPWVDLVFGLTEGWWLFNDGRTHACIHPSKWEPTLRANGYGYVDWTEGDLPESEIQQIIIAAASDEEYHRRTKVRPSSRSKVTLADCSAREESLNALVSQHVQGFTAPKVSGAGGAGKEHRTVLITGATGSLGAHLVAHFAALATVDKVVCLNRESESDAEGRQLSALVSRGLELDDAVLAKLHVLETDASKAQLGLSTTEYIHLAGCVTDIVHNAWPMSLTRKLLGFTNQFKTMRNLINLARACRQVGGPRIGFQLIGSVATVGYHPYVTGQGLVPEVEMEVASAMPIGYAEAKLGCEKILQETLRLYPDHFRAMTVRLGQIAGSRITGGWNEAEHIAQMIKSSQTLNALPDLQGDLSWCPANDIATSLGEVLMHEASAHAVYHIENPVRQSWPEMIRTIASALNIPLENMVPFDEWLARVRDFPPSLADAANPAAKILPFWQEDFVRMSCGSAEGGLVLDTTHTKEQSSTFRSLGKVEKDLVVRYLNAWKESGFLS